MVTAITFFVVLHCLDVERAAVGASRRCAGRLLCMRVAAAVRVHHFRTHDGEGRTGASHGGVPSRAAVRRWGVVALEAGVVVVVVLLYGR
jgi:hypothetical protein